MNTVKINHYKLLVLKRLMRAGKVSGVSVKPALLGVINCREIKETTL